MFLKVSSKTSKAATWSAPKGLDESHIHTNPIPPDVSEVQKAAPYTDAAIKEYEAIRVPFFAGSYMGVSQK